MTVFGKGLSRCLFYTFPQGAWRRPLFLHLLPHPPLWVHITYWSLGLFSNEKANSYKVGLNNITFPAFGNLWNVSEMFSNTLCCKETERICLVRIDTRVRKRTRTIQLENRLLRGKRRPLNPHPCKRPLPTLCRQGNGGPKADSDLPQVTQPSPPEARACCSRSRHAPPSTVHHSPTLLLCVGALTHTCTCNMFYKH